MTYNMTYNVFSRTLNLTRPQTTNLCLGVLSQLVYCCLQDDDPAADYSRIEPSADSAASPRGPHSCTALSNLKTFNY